MKRTTHSLVISGQGRVGSSGLAPKTHRPWSPDPEGCVPPAFCNTRAWVRPIPGSGWRTLRDGDRNRRRKVPTGIA
jgi:hypothetical protein